MIITLLIVLICLSSLFVAAAVLITEFKDLNDDNDVLCNDDNLDLCGYKDCHKCEEYGVTCVGADLKGFKKK